MTETMAGAAVMGTVTRHGWDASMASMTFVASSNRTREWREVAVVEGGEARAMKCSSRAISF